MAFRLVALIGIAAVLVAAGCAGGESTSGSQPTAQRATLVDVDGIFPLKRAFNDDRGHARLVLFLSPT